MKIQVDQPTAPAPEVPVHVIATSIEQISSAMKALTSTRLSRKAIVALIHDQSKVPKRTIEVVLNNLESLETSWLKPTKP